MTIWQAFLEALESLSGNKLRSGLTVLGIVIGVAAVIAMLAVGRGAEESITGSISGIGTNLIGSDPNATTNVATAMGYRAWGMPRTVDYGNGTRLTADYNSMRQQLANYKVQQIASGGMLLEQYYDYYENGINNGKLRRLGENASFTQNARRFLYDSFNRLQYVQSLPSYSYSTLAKTAR